LNTRPAWLTTDIKELLPGRKIDAEILDDLETRLITADVGAEATTRILEELRKRVARKELERRGRAAQGPARRHARHPEARRAAAGIDPRRQALRHLGGRHQRRRQDHHHRQAGAPAAWPRAQRHAGRRRHLPRGGARTAEVWAERNKVPIIAQQAGAEPAAVIFDALQAARARNIDVLIADTAGRLHTQTHLMDELKKVKRVLARLDPTAPHEVLLVLDGTIGQNAVAQAEEFNKGLGVTGLVVTKLDGTAKGGVVLAIAQKLKIPIRFVGVGEQSEDFGVFNASEFVSALLKSDGDEGRGAGDGRPA
jgi:fused signal recognition particle receptor